LFLLLSIIHEGDLIFIDVQSSLRDISYDEIKKHLFIIKILLNILFFMILKLINIDGSN
jgi:hypothetical protein